MAQYTILLVDYDPRSIERAKVPLENAGFRVEVSKDGLSAMTAFEEIGPDLVLLEAMIPKKHGFEVCQELKKTPAGQNTPIIIITAVYKGRKYRMQAVHLHGADAYVERPIPDEELVSICREHIGADAAQPADPPSPPAKTETPAASKKTEAPAASEQPQAPAAPAKTATPATSEKTEAPAASEQPQAPAAPAKTETPPAAAKTATPPTAKKPDTEPAAAARPETAAARKKTEPAASRAPSPSSGRPATARPARAKTAPSQEEEEILAHLDAILSAEASGEDQEEDPVRGAAAG